MNVSKQSSGATRSMVTETSRTRLLCVDDEPGVLEGITLTLRRRQYDVTTAGSGAAALEAIRQGGAPAVVISDMRMPGMDGTAFLAKVRQVSPDTVRMLLTGQADIESAIAVVNEGQIFRFLTKPCSPSVLLGAVEAAVEQHRLITAERVLLEQTLHGSIKTLVEVLALTNPVSFGRAMRVKEHVTAMAEKLSLGNRWQVEVAAMLSQLGYVTLPAEVAEKVYEGRPLSPEEATLVARVPAVTEQLLGNIPRLEVVRGILAAYPRSISGTKEPESADRALIARGAQLLRVATDFDTLQASGMPPRLAISTMRGRVDRYDPIVLGVFEDLRSGDVESEEVREFMLRDVRVGMVLADDVKSAGGLLLATRGYVVTETFLARSVNSRRDPVREPVRVVVSALERGA